MNDQQLAERFAQAADMLPPPRVTTVVDIEHRAKGRRRRRRLGEGMTVLAVLVSAAIVVPSLVQPDAQPLITPLTEQLDGGREHPPGTDEDLSETAMPADAQQAPRLDQLDTAPGFELYTITPPPGWQHVQTAVRTISSDSWTWVETRWTPSGTDGGGERDARLHLRQTDLSTLGGQSMPIHPDANEIELSPNLPAYSASTPLQSGVELHMLEWRRGDTYLELTGQGLTAQEMIEAAATAAPAPPG